MPHLGAPQYPIRTRMIKTFKNRQELVELCISSSYIPFYLEPRPWMELNGKKLVDGGFIDIRRDLDRASLILNLES